MTTLPYRRALVTGGTRGIGLALATALRREGLEVMVCGRDPGRLDEALRGAPGLRGLAVDLAVPEQRARLVELSAEELGGLDLLIHNAGIQRQVDFTRPEQGPSQTTREIEVNLVALLHLSRLALPHLLRAPGPRALVFVTSILAVAPKAVAPVYCASKAGLRSACRSLRAQLQPAGVGVVELVPPLVDTDMTAGRGEDKMSPRAVADALVEGLRAGQDRVAPGMARAALWLHRWAPALLERKMLSAG